MHITYDAKLFLPLLILYLEFFHLILAHLSLNICACDMFHGRNDMIPQDIPMKLFHIVVKFDWI